MSSPCCLSIVSRGGCRAPRSVGPFPFFLESVRQTSVPVNYALCGRVF